MPEEEEWVDKKKKKKKKKRSREGGRSSKCDARRAAFLRWPRRSRSPFFPIRPLLRLRCARTPASKRDLVNGIRAVRRSSRRTSCAFCYPSEIKASRARGTRACRDEQTDPFGAVSRGIRLIVYLYFSICRPLHPSPAAQTVLSRNCIPPTPEVIIPSSPMTTRSDSRSR